MTDITGALAVIEKALQEGMTLDDISYDDDARKRAENALSLITAIRKAVPDGLGDAVYKRFPNMASQSHNLNLTMIEYPRRIEDAAMLLQQITGESDDKIRYIK